MTAEDRSLLEEAEGDVLVFYAFPAEHWPKLRPSNPLERFNREIGRRTEVVGIFPDDASLIRLVSMLAIEANDEWLVGRGYISRDSMPLSRRDGPAEMLQRQGGHRVRCRVSTNFVSDEMNVDLLHHVWDLTPARLKSQKN